MNRTRISKISVLLAAASLAFTMACGTDQDTPPETNEGTQQVTPSPKETAAIPACSADTIGERITALNEAITRKIANSPFADQHKEGKFTIRAEKRTKIIEDKEGTQNIEYIALTVKGSVNSKGKDGFERFNGFVKPFFGPTCVVEVSYGGSTQDPSTTSFKSSWCEEGKQVCADGECRERCTNKQ
ncbi:MAG TPA: hypothetical protein VMM38_15725 [Aridibacter sp.]|nr:hypothetical protein [Aridibacter sp.]